MEKKEIKTQESTSLVNTICDVCDQIYKVLLEYGIDYLDAVDMTADIAKEIVDVLDI